MNDHLGLPYKAALLDDVTFSVHQTAALYQEWQIILQTAAQRHIRKTKITFRHKIFYLKHLVLTDIHYPTANLLAHSIYLEQEAIAQHCITLLSITAADPKLPNPYKKFTKIQMPASKISKPHPFCPYHIDCLETFLQTLSKACLFQEYISVSFHTKVPPCYCSSKQIL